MTRNHWLCFAVVAVVAYFVGAYYPQWGRGAISKAQDLVS